MDITAIKRKLDEVSRNAPSTGKGQLIITAVQEGIDAELTHKINPNWTIGAFGTSDWTGKTSWGVRLKGTW